MFKKLYEMRDELKDQLEAMLALAETEERALTDEESASFDELEGRIKAIDDTIAREERARNLGDRPKTTVTGTVEEQRAEADSQAFANYILGRSNDMEQRAGEQNITMANNGAIIPTSIANRIIKTVYDLCPILSGATRYSVPGTLKVPVWGDAGSSHNIAVGYQTEFTDITADAGKFTSVDLGGFLAGALTLIGRSVENNSVFSVTDFVVQQMAQDIARWIEGQLLTGTGNSAATGACTTTNTLTAAAAAAVTTDELIGLQAKIKQAYQKNACWTMAPDTFVALKKLKDGNNRYLLQDDYSAEFPYRLLGKPVHLSDNMPAMAAGAKAILYGDYSGLSVNFRENISIEVLREKYATQHAIGVVSWFEFDSKVTDNQRLATLTMKAD